MTEGAILKAYVGAKEISVVGLADSMRISRQRIYNIYGNKKLSKATRSKVESALKTKWSDIERFVSGVNVYDNVSREITAMEPEAPYGDIKDKLIASLEREVVRLKSDLDLSLGEMRHNILMNRAMQGVTQDLVIEVLAKQNKLSEEQLKDFRAAVGIKNGESYLKLKEEGKFAYAGK